MSKVKMKIVVVIIFVAILMGCENQNNTGDEFNAGLSGTWRYTQVHRFYSEQTDEYLYTDSVETSIIVSEDADGIRYYECWQYGGDGIPAIKTENNLYLNSGNTVYTLNDDGSYSTQEETNITYDWMTDTYFNRHSTLSKLSDDVVIDKGLLVLSGNVELAEYSHVCLWRYYSDLSDQRAYELIVPYDDSYLGMRLDLASVPPVGSVEYTPFAEGASILSFDIVSNANLFWDTEGSNSLYPESATINIVESTSSTLSGSFSFTGQDNGEYSGEFQMDLTN